jgi:hypothetical protein
MIRAMVSRIFRNRRYRGKSRTFGPRSQGNAVRGFSTVPAVRPKAGRYPIFFGNMSAKCSHETQQSASTVGGLWCLGAAALLVAKVNWVLTPREVTRCFSRSYSGKFPGSVPYFEKKFYRS